MSNYPSKTMNYLIESQGDDTVISRNIDLAKKYSQKLFKLISDEQNIQTFTTIPSTLPPENYFILVSHDINLLLNEIMTMKLYKIDSVETGWIRSIKIRMPRLIKEISIKAVDVLTESNFDEVNDEEIDEEIEDCEMNEQERNAFFASVSIKPLNKNLDDVIYNQEKKDELILFIGGKLREVDNTDGKINKMAVCLEIFNKLAEPTGKIFVHNHKRFSDTVKAKMIFLFKNDDFQELKDLYFKIFDEHMPI